MSQQIQHLLRNLHLLHALDYCRYPFRVLVNRRSNTEFLRANPVFAVPPSYLAYDAYSVPNWEFYHRSGTHLAEYLVERLIARGGEASPVSVLEWGCGPGRIIRHLPKLLPVGSRICGSDYNPESIAWAREHIPGVEFYDNNLHSPLPFEDGSFDSTFAISVFTHLSVTSGQQWIAELARILKQDGRVLLTTHSDTAAEALLRSERASYESNGFCMRGKVQEGKKMFATFMTPAYVKETLLKDFDLLEHIEPGSFRYNYRQDVWIAAKKKS